jgi:protein-S-isoprenylcysteine O-methyltransferase Ste14
VTKGVTASFEITDELYNYNADPAGTPIEVLAEATSPNTGKTFPQVFVVKHPKSRIVGLTLGHDARAHDLPEYQALLRKAKGNPDLYALRMIYLLQAVLVFIISAPIQVGVFESGTVGVIGWIGLAVWLVGVFFEAVGDHQMESFRRDPANKGKVIDSGLWRYTRHPNYFGDACVWWGIFLVAAEQWPGVLTVFAPVIMTLLLPDCAPWQAVPMRPLTWWRWRPTIVAQTSATTLGGGASCS